MGHDTGIRRLLAVDDDNLASVRLSTDPGEHIRERKCKRLDRGADDRVQRRVAAPDCRGPWHIGNRWGECTAKCNDRRHEAQQRGEDGRCSVRSCLKASLTGHVRLAGAVEASEGPHRVGGNNATVQPNTGGEVCLDAVHDNCLLAVSRLTPAWGDIPWAVGRLGAINVATTSTEMFSNMVTYGWS